MTDLPTLQHAISGRAFLPEQEAVQALLASLAHMEALEPAIASAAGQLVREIRAQGAGAGLEVFLQEYGLNTAEGVAVMCLAEALLRIPDARTADALIHDKLEGGAWDAHLGHSDSWLVNASSWGLLLTGKMVELGGEYRARPGSLLAKLARELGDPVVRSALKSAMRHIGHQFVLGETVADALKAARPLAKKGYCFSYDMLGEGARSGAQAQHYFTSYLAAIAAIAPEAKGKPLFEAPGLSVKLSGLHPRYQLTKAERVMGELLPRLRTILLRAKEAGITVSIDAEEASRLDIELELFAALAADPALAGWNGLGFVLQAYQKRAVFLIEWLSRLARETGRVIPVRLVKGAYWDAEIKWAQMQGLPGYPVFTRKHHTDVSYLACADRLLAAGDCFFPQFATHNARTVESIRALAAHHGIGAQTYEFQRLHGMGEALHDRVLAGNKVRVYAPVGAHKDLLAYLIRRLLENGANSSFVHLLMDRATPVDTVVEDPITRTRREGGRMSESIPLPERLYGEARANSRGADLGNAAMLRQLREGVAAHAPQVMARHAVQVADANAVAAAVARAQAAQPAWEALGVARRAEMLRSLADRIESSRDEMIALLALEGGKTLPDAIAEVREAADFCRYYAAQAQALMPAQPLAGPTGEHNALSLHARGVFACISPWNFPLAIFTGQVAAALATGNAALAKPAAQTPRIAALAVSLMHAAGVPRDCVQLIIGSGRVAGEALVRDSRVHGVVFTGSTDTARHIQRALAAREEGPLALLIAETGGQNCMVVDSSALLEAAVDDIVLSAFGSAGQRCSALRVVFVQEEIADALIALLAGAMQELALGEALNPATDIGPVIDAGAKAALEAHIARMQKEAALIATVPYPESLRGEFVAPHAFEIRSITQLTQEHFGPVLHVIRYRAEEMAQVADAINATGYGLTFGIHSRIGAHVEFFLSRIRAGNRYVNRGMTGAVVGVQPFGGEGLSGTGPKAGGPHYLPRFCVERTDTINVAAIGGNVGLLAGA